MKLRSWPLLAILSISAVSLAAREGGPSFQDVVDVDVLNLEAYVTDKDGLPVTDLDRDDFDLFIDGDRVEMTNFYAVRQGRRRAADRTASTPGRPVASADPVFLVVFVDNLQLGQFTRNRALEALEGFLGNRFRANDRIMVASFDGRVRLHQSFTREWKEVEGALDLVSREPSFGHLRENQEHQLLNDMMALSDLHKGLKGSGVSRTRCPSQLGQMAARHAEDVYNQVRASVAGLSEFVAGLGSLPGRKALVHVSDGIPFQAGAGVYEFLYQYCGGQGEILDPDTAGSAAANASDSNGRSLALGAINPAADGDVYDSRRSTLEANRLHATSLFEELERRANANRVTLYTLEATGARGFSAGEARRRARRTLSRRADEVRWASLQDSLSTMADTTGGRAILDTVDLARDLELIGRDLDTYYSLGYSLPESEDGRTFQVNVKVRRAGLRVRHRTSLRSASLRDELAGRTRAALLFDVVDNPLDVALEVGRTQAVDELHMVPIRLRIPLARVAFLPEDGGHHGQLRIFVTGQDRGGRMAEVRAVEVPITIPDDQLEAARSQDFLYVVRMLMRQGEHKLAVGVHDVVGAAASFLTEDVLVTPGLHGSLGERAPGRKTAPAQGERP